MNVLVCKPKKKHLNLKKEEEKMETDKNGKPSVACGVRFGLEKKKE